MKAGMKSSSSESKHAIRPKLVRGVGEEEEVEWNKLAEKLKATKKKEGEEGEKREEEIDLEEEEEDEKAEHGRRRVKKVHDPKLPTNEEVKEHYLSGHMPYRSWCHHCVGGRGRERDHTKKGDEEQQGIPEYHMDYCFPGDEFNERLTVLVVIEKYTKMKKAVVVPNKGSTGGFAAKMVLDLINECGDKDRDVILKTDQEPAIKFLVDDVCRTGWLRGRSRQLSNAFGP